MKDKARNFKNLLKADMYDLSKHKSVYIGLALTLVIILFMFVMVWVASNLLEQLTVAASDEDMGAEAEVMELNWVIGLLSKTLLAGFSSTAPIALFILIIAGIFVGGAFKCGGIRRLVGRGSDRTQIYMSKLLTLSAVLLVYMVAAILFAGILTAVGGYGNDAFTAKDFGILARNFALQLLSQLSVLSVGVMLGFLIRSKSGAIWSMIGLSILLDTIFGAIYGIERFGINTDWIMFMPFEQLDIAGSTTYLTDIQAVAATVMPVFYICLSTAIGLYTFNKRDIK